MDLSEYSSSLRLLQRTIELLIKEAEAKLTNPQKDSELISAIATDVDELKLSRDRYRRLISEEVEAIDRLNRSAESLRKEEDAFADECHRVSIATNQIVSKFNNLKAIFERSKNRESSNNTSLNQSFTAASPRFPKIMIPEFYGNIKEFLNFKNVFVDLVHNNPDLSEVQKLHYLKSAVKDEAALSIRDFELSSAAYVEAWEFLCQRYENRRLIIASHFEDLLSVEPVKSDQGLRELTSRVDATLRALKLCGFQIGGNNNDAMSPFVCYLVASKLDAATRKEWENSVIDQQVYPSYSRLSTFLNTRFYSLNEIERSKSTTSNPSWRLKAKKADKKAFVAGTVQCPVCSASHVIESCKLFLEKTPRERNQIARSKLLCFKCLKADHSSSECKMANCLQCNYAHHVLLHYAKKSEYQSKVAGKTEVNSRPHPEVVTSTNASLSSMRTAVGKKVVLLPTAVVRVGTNNTFVFARILLDSGSQVTLVSRSFVRKARLKSIVSPNGATVVDGIGLSPITCNRSIELVIRSQFEDFALSIVADVVPKIPYDVPSALVRSLSERLPEVNFAESNLVRTEVDIIVGSEYYERCLKPGTYQMKDVILRDTYFGWVATGAISGSDKAKSCCHFAAVDVENQLKRFWEIEEAVIDSVESSEADMCVRHFESTYSRSVDGQFIVRLPFKDNKTAISGTFGVALNSLKRIERKYEDNIRRSYIEFMREYALLGHMEPVATGNVSPVYYIPHRAVIRPNSSTTKLRVVFNASAKCRDGCSLNDALMVGPSIQPDLFDILVRFRAHRIAFCADIEKMYRCILVHPSDRALQTILWRENVTDPIRSYQLTTVTYGTAPASFIATKCLSVLANNVADVEPAAATSIMQDFYMDDLLTGADSLNDAVRLQKAVHHTLAGARFPLRKYMSNSEQLLREIEPSLVASSSSFQIENTESVSVLGLRWNPTTDKFGLSIDSCLPVKTATVSKRIILSEVARIFDPLGLVSPVTIRAKLLLQELWREQKNWDEPVSDELSRVFHEFRNDLGKLTVFSVPRCYTEFDLVVNRKLVGFSDASRSAYCAVIYMVSENSSGETDSRLVCAKTRVAPAKELTIPRLELQAAWLLAQLMDRVSRELKIVNKDCSLFSDSTTVLCWLSSSERWTVFVNNRVAKILKLFSKSQWRYVRTSYNPADLATRGISASQLNGNALWLRGPEFLRECSELPFESSIEAELCAVPEQRKARTVCNTIVVDSGLVDKFSSLCKLISVIAYVRRFVQNCKGRNSERATTIVISASERESALQCVLRLVQRTKFADEVERLQRGKPIRKSSSLASLAPFLDDSGLLRVGGRLRNSSLSFNQKHPVIVPAKTVFARLLVRDTHLRYFHAGKLFILNLLNVRYWFIGGLVSVVKRIIHECVVCVRHSAFSPAQLMGQLPASRVNISRPFSHVGVDFAGPFTVKCVEHRSVKFNKIYIAIFVCFATRAVHIEVVSNLSTDKFISCLRRFVARRGVPAHVYSDNATNFVGAKNRLVLDGDLIKTHASLVGMTWSFIPPRAPHQGGIWEAAVRSAKFHLVRITNGQVLDYEQYGTLFSEIEAILNSRPLCYRNTGSSSYDVLTPAHFLIGESLLIPASLGEPTSSVSLSRRYSLTRDLIASFWSKWSKDYLNQLTVRTKWKQPTRNFVEGDVVLLKEDSTPPQSWQMGRVVQVFPDRDGLVRIVDVHVGDSVKRRNIVKLVPLICDNSVESSGEYVNGKSASA